MTTEARWTPGEWAFACDSYGKVRHSKKACVFSFQDCARVASRVENWHDARLMAASKDLYVALERLVDMSICSCNEPYTCDRCLGAAALAKARGDRKEASDGR